MNPTLAFAAARAPATAVALAALVLGAACIGKPPEVPSARIVDYPTRQVVLPSGLRVVLEQAPDFGVAGAVLVVGAGAADDPAQRAGLAHLVEHLAFEAAHPGLPLVDLQRDLGASGVNAQTSWDTTTFYAFADTQMLGGILTSLAGLLREPLAGVDDRLFQRELSVVGSERRLRTENGTPGQAVGWLMSEVFSGHPYGHPPVGTAESLAHVTLDDARAFAAASYRPEASTLVVSAPFSIHEQEALVERVLAGPAAATAAKPDDGEEESDAPAATPQRRAWHRPDVEPRAQAGALRSHEAEVPTPTLWIGWVVPSDFRDAGDMSPLLASAFEGSVDYDLRRRDPDVAYVDAGVWGGVGASLLYVRAALKRASDPETTARSLITEMEGAVANWSSRDVSIEVLKRLAVSHYAYGEESIVERARHLAWSSHHLARPWFLRERGDRMLRLSAADVSAFGRKFLGRERAGVLLVRPARDVRTLPPPVSMEGARSTPAARAPATAGPQPLPAAAPAGASSAIPAVLRAPAPQPRRFPVTADLEERELSNGLRLIVLPRRGSPFHTALLGFEGGQAQSVPPGVATAASWARVFSTESPNLRGLYRQHLVETDATVDLIRSTGTDIRLTLRELRRSIEYSLFWPPRRMTEMLEVLEREERAPPVALGRALARATFGTHPLGTVATVEGLKRITPAEVMRWSDRTRRPQNGAVVIVGDVDVDEALHVAEAELGAWRAGPDSAAAALEKPAALERLPPGQRERVVVEDRPGAEQARLRFDCLLPRATADGIAAHQVFAMHIQQRMHDELRAELGGSYTVHVGVDVHPGGTAVLSLTADVAHARLAEALRRLRRLAIAPDAAAAIADEAALAPARHAAAVRARFDAATTPHMAAELFDLWNLGWPLRTLDRLPEQALVVPAAAVASVAAHCRENWVVGLLGDGRVAREAWSASAP